MKREYKMETLDGFVCKANCLTTVLTLHVLCLYVYDLRVHICEDCLSVEDE